MLNPLCVKITRPFITKYGTPLAPITKYGTPYVLRSYTHSLQNMEPLLPLLLNIEHLMCQDHTPNLLRNMEPFLPLLLNMEHLMCQDHTSIHYEMWNSSCPYY